LEMMRGDLNLIGWSMRGHEGRRAGDDGVYFQAFLVSRREAGSVIIKSSVNYGHFF